MHISKLSSPFNYPEEGIHCIQMQCTRNFNTEVFEICHVIESPDALVRFLEHYNPVPRTDFLRPHDKDEIDYPALTMMRWAPIRWEEAKEDEWFNASFEVVSTTAVKQMLNKIKEELGSGDNQKNKE